jgi:hypothetical protein
MGLEESGMLSIGSRRIDVSFRLPALINCKHAVLSKSQKSQLADLRKTVALGYVFLGSMPSRRSQEPQLEMGCDFLRPNSNRRDGPS